MKILPGGVMVAREILALVILVRVQARQQSREPFEGPKRLKNRQGGGFLVE